MKGKIEFGEFVEALVKAQATVNKAAGLEDELAAMEKRNVGYAADVAAVKRELDSLSEILLQQKAVIAKDLAETKAANDEAMRHYQSMIDLEKESLRSSVLKVRSEADASIREAQKAKDEAQSATKAAKDELMVLLTDLDAARAAATKLANFAAAGKA